jgi:acyl carrier protein
MMSLDKINAVIVSFLLANRSSLYEEIRGDWAHLTFERLALDSLDLTALSLDVEDELEIEIGLDDLQACETLGGLRDWILSRTP